MAVTIPFVAFSYVTKHFVYIFKLAVVLGSCASRFINYILFFVAIQILGPFLTVHILVSFLEILIRALYYFYEHFSVVENVL